MSTSHCGHKLAVVTRLRFCSSPPPLDCHLPAPVIFPSLPSSPPLCPPSPPLQCEKLQLRSLLPNCTHQCHHWRRFLLDQQNADCMSVITTATKKPITGKLLFVIHLFFFCIIFLSYCFAVWWSKMYNHFFQPVKTPPNPVNFHCDEWQLNSHWMF